MRKIFWIALAVFIALPFSLAVKANVILVHPNTTLWKVVGHNPTTVSPQVALQALHVPNGKLAMETIKSTFPDTVWIRKFDWFPEMTFGAGHVCKDVYALFDEETKALRWKLYDGTEIVFVLGCNNVAWRRTEILPAVATIVPAPVVAGTLKTTWNERSKDSMLRGLGFLFLAGPILAFFVWLIRRIIQATPINPPTTPVMTTATMPPTPEVDADAFEAKLDVHDENIRSLNRLLDAEEACRQALIDDRLTDLDGVAQATEAERYRLRNLRNQN